MAPILPMLISGKFTTHIFLCQGMKDAFFHQNKTLKKNHSSVVIPNDYVVNASLDKDTLHVPESKSETITGHLSNLTIEKGSYEYLLFTKKALKQNIIDRAWIAGPCHDEKIIALIRNMEERFGNRFRYFGSIDHSEKQSFFQSITHFIFPTAYGAEAQPLVLVESLSFGVPLLCRKKGCIPFDFGHSSPMVKLVGDTETLEFAFAQWANEISSFDGGYQRVSFESRWLFEQRKKRTNRCFEDLIEAL